MAVMKVLEIMAESEKSWEDATAKAVAKASETVKNIRSAYVQDQSVTVKDNKLHMYRVDLRITFEVQ
ncbi:MAG: dodecin domain-containing protein [Phaeodactylibacter sp.]|nr:dodecin domain-containing protein [Phaeodactylibacter sp.]